MEIKLKLNHDILREIAEAKANKVAYDWFESTGEIPDATELYTEAFLDGMLYMVERLKNSPFSQNIHFFLIFFHKNLHMSKKSCNFAPSN